METKEIYSEVVKYSAQVAKKCNKEKISFLSLYATDNLMIDFVLKKSSKILQDILVVTNMETDFDIEKVKILSTEDWEDKKEKYLYFLRNAFVIINEEGHFMQDFQKYFPVVFMPISSTEFSGWKKRDKEDLGISILYNINLFKFDSFAFEEDFFQELTELNPIDNGDIFQDTTDDSESVVLEQKETNTGNKVITREKAEVNSENWSIFKNLPQPPFVPPDFSSKRWKMAFYNYLKRLVSLCIPNDISDAEKELMTNVVLNNNTINNEWRNCFTYKLKNLNPGKNYEVYEKMGDKILEYCLILYSRKKYPNISESEITNIRKAVLSKPKQGLIAGYMEFYKWIDLPEELRESVATGEDIFEAFFGAIDTICNKKKMGLSVKLVYTFLENFYEGYTFIDELKIDNPTFLQQLFDPLSVNKRSDKKPYFLMKRPNNMDSKTWSKVIGATKEIISSEDMDYDILDQDPGKKEPTLVKKENKIDNREEVTWTLTPYGASILKSYGIKIKAGVLGRGLKPTKNEAKNEASDRAADALAEKGVTIEWRDKIKEMNLFKNIENFEEAKMKAKTKHPDIESFGIIDKTLKYDKIMVFWGRTEDGHMYNLFTYISKAGEKGTYKDLIDAYLQS